MKHTKLLAVSLFSIVACLASCATGGGNYSDQTLTSTDPTSEKTIIFWGCLGHNNETNTDKVVTAFNEQYKGKYKVDFKKVAGNYDSLHDAIKTKLAAGEVPAIAMGYPDSFSVYMTKDINQASIYRLDSFMDDKTFGFTADEKADFVQQYMAEGQNYQFSGTWSLPMYKSTEIMYYNDSYFHGLNPQNAHKFNGNTEFTNLYNAVKNGGSTPTSSALEALKTWCVANSGYTYEVPTLWSQMIQVGQKMQADLKTESITDEFYPIGYDSDANMLISQFAQRGIGYTTNDAASQSDVSKHFTFVNDDAKAFVKEIVDLEKAKTLITKGVLGDYTNTKFTENKCAMTIGSTGGSSYNVSSNFKVSLAAVPYADGQKAQYIMQGPSICFFNNNDPYIHKGAWLFYKMLSSTKYNTTLSLSNSYDPVRNSCYDTDEYKSWIAKHDKGLNYDIPYHTQNLRGNYMTSPVFFGSSTARKQMDLIIGDVVKSGYSVDEAFNRAYKNCVAAA